MYERKLLISYGNNHVNGKKLYKSSNLFLIFFKLLAK